MTGISLTAAEARVLTALREANGIASHESLRAALLQGRPEVASDRWSVKVYVRRMRRKGVGIVSVRGVGYGLAPLQRCPTCGHGLDSAEA